jgi:hypothetical protein
MCPGHKRRGRRRERHLPLHVQRRLERRQLLSTAAALPQDVPRRGGHVHPRLPGRLALPQVRRPTLRWRGPRHVPALRQVPMQVALRRRCLRIGQLPQRLQRPWLLQLAAAEVSVPSRLERRLVRDSAVCRRCLSAEQPALGRESLSRRPQMARRDPSCFSKPVYANSERVRLRRVRSRLSVSRTRSVTQSGALKGGQRAEGWVGPSIARQQSDCESKTGPHGHLRKSERWLTSGLSTRRG